MKGFHVCDKCEKEIRGEPKIVFIAEEVAKVFCDFSCFKSWFSERSVGVSKLLTKRMRLPSLSGVDMEKVERRRRLRRRGLTVP